VPSIKTSQTLQADTEIHIAPGSSDRARLEGLRRWMESCEADRRRRKLAERSAARGRRTGAPSPDTSARQTFSATAVARHERWNLRDIVLVSSHAGLVLAADTNNL
jgi:hypothetical protein